MGDNSKIEWTNATWNPITGCDKISPGCDNCYAERIAERFRGSKAYPNGFDLSIHERRFYQPIKWARPRLIFVNSMSDMFHKAVPKDTLDQLFAVMEQASHHTYQILTKRSSIMRDYINHRYGLEGAPRHIWLGVSVEDGQRRSRIDHLRDTRAAVRFLSIEPLIDDVGTLDLRGIHWVIVGGESGPGAREVNPWWIRGIRDQCIEWNVPFFFKQWGGRNAKAGGRILDGREWSMMPGDIHRKDDICSTQTP